MKGELERAAKHWSVPGPATRIGWWYKSAVLQHINELVCGQALAGPWAGLQKKMRDLCPGTSFQHGISIGCGEGTKELELLKKGIVHKFELYEISQSRVDRGRAEAERMGVSDRVTFHVADVFEQRLTENCFDLVYWNNSLHHMLDVDSAIRWSHDRLAPGGYFVMDDYVGPSRFQWTIFQLIVATLVRTALPRRLRIHPTKPQRTQSRIATRPAIKSMIATDPTEAADSENILSSVVRTFPEVEIIPTGGLVYFLALNSLLQNFNDQDDGKFLKLFLSIDEKLARMGHTYYAVAIASKR